jgi:hypothetical protein
MTLKIDEVSSKRVFLVRWNSTSESGKHSKEVLRV